MGVQFLKPPVMNMTLSNSVLYRAKSDKEILLVGKKRCIYKTLLQFNLSCLPSLLTILGGTLHVFICENLSPLISKTVNLHQVLSCWNEKSPDCREPVIDPFPTAQATLTAANNLFLDFDITSLVTDWYSGKETNFGILLGMNNETQTNLIGFRSADYPVAHFWPYLEVSFLDEGNHCVHETIDVDYHLITTDNPQATAKLYVQIFEYTYFVINTGSHTASVALELSPDGVYWIPQSAIKLVGPGKIEAIVPDKIGKYARLVYQSLDPGQSTSLEVQVRGSA